MNQIEELNEYDTDPDFERITKMFPDAKFQIGIIPYKLDEVITNKTLIIIKQIFNCACYGKCIQEPKYFVVAGPRITSEYIIHELIKQDFKIECNHIFIERFEQCNDIDYQFNIIQHT